MKSPVSIAMLAALCLLTASPAAYARRGKNDHEAARAALASGHVLPLTRILELAARRVPGDVLKVELEPSPSGLRYELKILARNGRIRELELDARTGALLKVEDD